ncbi:von Willebrand factor type A domain-containing protein [Mycolicibacterium rutilum]|uniref:von Willebrand factor type A domain-containing protein n=1 Tax=Mycolicibacterium rutilum TaxID=370526 RepID=A0A1H6KS94_MYCRU|nr:substrate-binding domain-containing protein [Mycolicibacterium rutilum]SEH78702.1 von Willebrand factor type A domain-containing protein [Mycolicibacterium rutilum]
MGRHSKPDPEDSAGEEFGDQHDESVTERFGHFGGSDAPDAGRDDEFDAPDYGDYPDYTDSADFPEDDDEPDFGETEPGGATPPPRVPPRSGPQHSGEWEGGEWTGSHRAVTAGRRGVSVSVIAALVAVVVVVGAVIVWRFVGDALSDRTSADAARCVDGEVSVAVVADPNIAAPIQTLAQRYNDTAAPVGDKCVKIGVKPAESDQVVNGFIGPWPAELGEQPALWIPGSSVSAARLEASTGAETVVDSRSLVTSPVLLAVRPQLKNALAQQNWSTLPGLQTNPTSLDGLNLRGWGALRLALPMSGDSDASYLAAEAVAAAAAPAGRPAGDGTRAVNTLVAGQPKLADKKSSTAMGALLDTADPAAAPVHAVVTTEQQLFQRGAGLPDAKNVLASWLPPGPTPTADFPTVLLSGNWLSQEQKTAASEFARFMRKPEQLAELVNAGFRVEGASPPQSDVTDFAPVPAPLSVGDNESRATLASALTAPVANPAVTIMLDQSMPADEGGRSRLANVVAALNARLQALPPSSAVGLWTFDGTAGRSEVSTGPLSDQVNGRPRSAALTSVLDEQSASGGGAVSFTTLRLVYTEAMANYRDGQKNSILVITTGPHTDQSLDGEGLQQYVRGAFDETKPVAVNVIDFGSDADRATWESVAQISGGRYQNLPTSDSPELTAAIADFLG